MFRKLALGFVATLALVGATASMPTAASAHGWYHGGWHHGWHGGWYHRHWGWGPRFYIGGPAYYGYYGGCYVRRLVPTPWGLRWRIVNRCY
jgi:hypothetical protein